MALFTDPGGRGRRGQRCGGCSGAGPPPGPGAGLRGVGCTCPASLPRGALLVALLPAPADLALGPGAGLLAAADGKRAGAECQDVRHPGRAPSPARPPAEPRPDSSACPAPERPARTPAPSSIKQQPLTWAQPARPGQPCAGAVSVVRRGLTPGLPGQLSLPMAATSPVTVAWAACPLGPSPWDGVFCSCPRDLGARVSFQSPGPSPPVRAGPWGQEVTTLGVGGSLRSLPLVHGALRIPARQGQLGAG